MAETFRVDALCAYVWPKAARAAVISPCALVPYLDSGTIPTGFDILISPAPPQQVNVFKNRDAVQRAEKLGD